jgi:Protein of unknown function (DUF1320).
MARFIQQTDYAVQIRPEIIKQLTSNDEQWYNSAALIRAENTAISQIKNRIGKRYDCAQIFGATTEGDTDSRDQWIVTVTIDLTLYLLYSKTGSKDIPEHRSQRFQDALDWLKDVSNGSTLADLPEMIDETTGEEYSEFRLNSRTPNNHKW